MKIKYQDFNFKEETLALIFQIDKILNEYAVRGMSLTVRQVYYQCVARKILENSQANYKLISRTLKNGRLAGLLDWDIIEDRTRYLRKNLHWTSPDEILQDCSKQYRIDIRAKQKHYIECWVEKESLISILEDFCSEVDVPCFACKGFNSISATRQTALRLNNSGRENIILYAGDFDPSGLNIPETTKNSLKDFGASFKLERIGLTLEQVQAFNLPPMPAKKSDARFEDYVKKTGSDSAWELDALPPEELKRIFLDAIDNYTDYNALQEMQSLQQEHKTILFQIMEDLKND